jgi:serine/threonine protein phosphatase PrpC
VSSIAVATASHRSHSEDRLLVLNTKDAWILGLADGAGGFSGGACAAEMFVAGVQSACARPDLDLRSAEAWSKLLADLDHQIAQAPEAGETTGIAMIVTTAALIGASCGDSEAWLFAADSHEELTGNQVRKPRLGSGRAEPRGFRATAHGILLMASDGLFRHAKADDVARTTLADPSRAPAALVGLLKTQHRKLPDDVAIIVAHLDGPAVPT